ncbi:hypothetical protein MLD38_035676 [Melastoma candidum]|uniref:Uncharacterized protein n=1 Tax=Melastoma candidum TaxID=119954 RepID=A0ACB9LHC9_9MYRT|nr:hypothetical protein MLD38_035676 [Melastoma candidum]
MAAAAASLDDDLIVLSDEEQRTKKQCLPQVRGIGDDGDHSASNLSPSKKPWLISPLSETPPPVPVLILEDDDVTPHRSSSIVVPETPLSSSVVIVKCTTNPGSFSDKCSDAGIKRLICLESDNENEYDDAKGNERNKENKTSSTSSGQVDEIDHIFTPGGSTHSADDCADKGNFNMEPMDEELYHERATYVDVQDDDGDQQMDEIPIRESQAKGNRKKSGANRVTKNKLTEEEKKRLMEEKKQKKEHEKLQKTMMKAEAAEMKRVQKEKQKWEKGKFALKSIVAQIDVKVVETGSIGGHLLSRLNEKGLTFRIKSNPVERSIVWSMNVPEHISEIGSEPDISYVSLVYEAEEFCNLVSSGSFLKHVQSIRSLYPSHTICYITNRLMAYINKREQELYKGPTNDDCWMRPPVEEVLAKLSTHFDGAHSRLCVDEAEVAEHIVGLTCSLATCLYRKKLTKLSVNANGSNIPKGAIDKTLLKNNCWLKALMAIPKVQPRFAIAIWKKYPSMKSLLKVYMDPDKSVHEKEFLLKDLTTEGLVADDRRLGEVCSKRVCRVLMAQSGNIKTDDVEDGADFFGNPSLSR